MEREKKTWRKKRGRNRGDIQLGKEKGNGVAQGWRKQTEIKY